MLGLVSLNQLKSLSVDINATMPKNKHKNIGTSSLKVKPKKRPGLIKQLSQPFFMTNKKNKNSNGAEPEKAISCVSKEDLGLFGGFDDMFLPDRTALSESVFLSPEIEKYLNSGKSPLTLEISGHREKCSSGDSGYMSPPNINEVTSPSSLIPTKGILKKMRSNSPDSRSNSPLLTVASPDSRAYMSSPAFNGHVTPMVQIRDRPMSPFERPMSPLGDDGIDSALGFLDDVIDQENVKKTVKKSVSFGQLAEVKNFTSDSSDNDICDDFKPITKSVSCGDVENLKRKKDTINKSFKKSVSFEDITMSTADGDELEGSDSCEELIPVHDSDSSLSDSEKFEAEDDGKSCSCEKICEFEVEVKVIDIQPLHKGQGQIDDEEEEYACKLLDTFNVMICHHPGCTKNNENRPMLLCKECDSNIHQRPEYTGHLVLDLPKRKSQHERTARFAHANSTPAFPNNMSMSSMDIEEIENDEGIEDGDGPITMETEQKQSKEVPEMGEVEKKLKRKKVVKAKRRHTTGVRSHSASDIFNGNDVQSDDEEIKGQRFSYHGSIDENALGVEEYKRRPSISSPPQALQRKGAINHETFTMKIRSIDNEDEDIEIVAAEKNVSLREAIQPILERRRISIGVINVFVEASNTPLPLNCETFLLGGTTMYIKGKLSVMYCSLPCSGFSNQQYRSMGGTPRDGYSDLNRNI
ncbi:uncharacterized protein LOC132728048 [Ruditapes philippinarum]|uniref:uncharacterized protein LOC132728048 n=1 Tax=Ruditapes philippinarum TaxID=129788 RepID=UPI00295B0862|nr:uncharacterized protein LOC132728048 [Ruditapes philippinarum]